MVSATSFGGATVTTTTSSSSSYSSTFAGLSLGTSGDLLNEFVPDLFTASPPWAGGDFNNSQESSLDGSGGPTGGVTLAAAAAAAAQMTSHHLPPVNTSNLQLSAPSPLSLIPSGGPLLAGHTTHSAGGMINWGSPPPSSGSGGGARPGSTCSGQMPPVLVSVSSRPSSRQSASSTPRPPSVSPAFSPAPNSVLGGCVHPSPVLSPVGNPSGLGMSGGSTCLATTAGTSSSSSSSAGQQQPSPASMTTPFSNNFPFSPLQDPIPPMPAASTPNNNTNPGTPFLDDMRDSKEGILLLNHGHYASAGTSHHATDKQQQSGSNVGALGSLLNHGDATSSSNSVAESGRLRILLMQRPGNAAQQQQQQSHLNSMNGSHLLGSLGDGDCGGVKREKEDQNGGGGGGGGGLMSGGSKGSHGNRILKGLLNQDDGDEVDHLTDDNRFPPQRGNSGNSSGNLLLQVGDGTAKPGNSSSVVAATASNNNNNNNMLHKLLNVRSDDDGEERLGLRRPK